MVHRRQLDGQVLVFGNQGDLWGNAMTWWDHDTGTVWSQPLGEAIVGPRKGATLDTMPSTFTQWSSWRDAHPDTVALDTPTSQGGFRFENMAVVLEFGEDPVAYPFLMLWEAGVANDVVAGAQVAVVIDPTDRTRWAVFSRLLDDRVVTLEQRGAEIVDVETGSVWDPVRGQALSGPLKGEILDLLPGFTSHPRDFLTFWPKGRFWTG